MKYEVCTFYKFQPLSDSEIESHQLALESLVSEIDLCGLIIMGSEGLNATLAAPKGKIDLLKNTVRNFPGFLNILFKDSTSSNKPFKRFKVKVRSEIVTLGRPDIVPSGETDFESGHLSPDEWHAVLESEEDYILVDTRNDYETSVGKFKDAIDPKIGMFSEFPEFVKKSDWPKDKKVLMYCTGGIRCEKAVYAVRELGYDKVYQLEGGILRYLEEFPDGHFDGECFVFDHRVAVNTELQESAKFGLCPHCGDPGCEKIVCQKCGTQALVCDTCLEADKRRHTCSKNCGYHNGLDLVRSE